MTEDEKHEAERAEVIQNIRALIASKASQDAINTAVVDAIERGYLDIGSAHRRIGLRKHQLEMLSDATLKLASGMEDMITMQTKRDEEQDRKQVKRDRINVCILVGLSVVTIAVLVGGKEALTMLSSISSLLRPLLATI